MEILHTPVLLRECLKYLSPADGVFRKNVFMIDSTLGEGGHSYAFLCEFPYLFIMGIDADCIIQQKAKERLAEFGERISFYNGWFDSFYKEYPENLSKPNIILFDLGISIFHYEASQRGFSFRYEQPLDMRLECSEERKTASDIVNNMPEDELASLIYRYGGEKFSRRIASAICRERKKGKIESSKVLADIIYDAVPSFYCFSSIHPATKTFQALRIEVNGELKRLPKTLHNAFNILETGGKMGVITFHSLEDRIVKNYFRNLSKRCICPPEFAQCKCGGNICAENITKKPVIASEEEIRKNPPSRSAKLRVVRKIKDADEYRLIKGEML